jgi:hypothetical protein
MRLSLMKAAYAVASSAAYRKSGASFVLSRYRLTEGKMLKSKQPETSSGVRWLSKFSGLLWFGQKCPLCTSILFTEAEHQSLDRLLSLLAFHPVRCANCFRRYYCFAKV